MTRVAALLLSDVVDSTQLNDDLGDEVMKELWSAHDRSARELILAWRGREVARSDGFLVLFDTASDAAGFALDYHDAVRAVDTRLKARVGLHVGPVALRENSELDRSRGAPQIEIDGVALPVVARVMAAALGAQTLLTASAVQALGKSTPHLVRTHGHWRLKGLTEPLELFEIGGRDTLFQPPPDSSKAYRVVHSRDGWIPARRIPNNLPAERDSFIGRSDALQTLASRLDGPTRLVTILGIGGIGKTRLAISHARTWLGDYPGGAWFCDLSTARGMDGIVYAVAQALDVPLGKSDQVQQIASSIAARGPCIVILDTFEQVARHAEATLGVWLEIAAEAKFIVTSREVLGIAGEQAQVLAPLGADEGARLFNDRAAAAAQRPAPSAQDRAAIAPLVQLLDGLPLAIELAAARSRVMSPAMLLDRMSERFTLLSTRGGRGDRQVTLRATLDWSWELLLGEERSALAQLSVFEGGFTLEAAEAIVVTSGVEATMLPMDLVQSLVDKSFVRRTGNYRFDLLQSVQEYASQHLRGEGRFEGSGASAALEAEVRHAIYFSGLSEQEVSAPGYLDVDNLSVACRRAAARGDSTAATRTLVLAWAALELRGSFELGVELSSLVLSPSDLPESLACEVQLIKGRASRALGKVTEARDSFEMALRAAQATQDRRCEAKALGNLGKLNTDASRTDEARAQLGAGLEVARAVGDRTLECDLLNGIGTLNSYVGQVEAALAAYKRALALARELGSRRWEGGVLGNLGNLYFNQGRLAAARDANETGLIIARELGNRQWEGNALCNLGLLLNVEGRTPDARAHLERALQVAREIGHPRLEAITRCNLGIIEESAADPEAARDHFESALRIAERLADRRSEGQILGYLGLLNTAQGFREQGRERLDAGRSHLEAIGDDSSLALLLCQSAEALAIVDDIAGARDHLNEANVVAARTGIAGALDLVRAIDRATARIKRT